MRLTKERLADALERMGATLTVAKTRKGSKAARMEAEADASRILEALAMAEWPEDSVMDRFRYPGGPKRDAWLARPRPGVDDA